MTKPRNTVKRILDPVTGQYFLQGKEKVTKTTANVFGNFYGLPLNDSDYSLKERENKQSKDKVLWLEVEVKFRREQVADDDLTDYADVFSFCLWTWSDGIEDPMSEEIYHWQDILADSEHDWIYPTRKLIREAIYRVRYLQGIGDVSCLWLADRPLCYSLQKGLASLQARKLSVGLMV